MIDDRRDDDIGPENGESGPGPENEPCPANEPGTESGPVRASGRVSNEGAGDQGGFDSDPEATLEDHEAEVAIQEAEEELREELGRESEKEYQKMAADLRWEVLEYCDAHPDKAAPEVARLFGIREGSIRAWKAHRTMGTYRGGASGGKGGGNRQRELFKRETAESSPPSFLERKRYSHFIHYFDKTPPGIVCPHFYILAHANGCPYACDYCYLRLTLRHYPEPTVFSNTARLFQELRDWLLSLETPSVLNAGELSDSLAWDPETDLSSNLVPLFGNQGRHKLLFLTKSAEVGNLLSMEPTPQVIVSFSINASEVSARYERGAPPPLKRLEAARSLVEAGWEVRLRLDPMVPVPGWQDAYGAIIGEINRTGPSVVTLGSLRYFRNLKSYGRKGSDIFSYGVDGGDPDRRLRIELDKRLEMYRFALERLECEHIGLCKETVEVHEALGLPGAKQRCNCVL